MINEDQGNLGLVLPQATRRGKSLGLKAAAGVGCAEDAANYTCSILLLGLNSSQESNPLRRNPRIQMPPESSQFNYKETAKNKFPVTETRGV